jgi:CspA family cold shock protein
VAGRTNIRIKGERTARAVPTIWMVGGRHVIATVVEWRDDEGWGLAYADEAPDGIWIHFSALKMEGYRALEPGMRVDVTVEGPLESGDHGYRFRARSARPVRRRLR